jgi:hypothetical protein
VAAMMRALAREVAELSQLWICFMRPNTLFGPWNEALRRVCIRIVPLPIGEILGEISALDDRHMAERGAVFRCYQSTEGPYELRG